jgi:iron(III) transport system substrate-binding protein
MLAREKLLSEFHSPYIADLPAAAVPAHRLWVSDRLNVFVVAYNTNKVRREELPGTLEGFVDPKWKGRIGLEATDAEWLGTIVKLWGPERGMAYFRKLADMKPDIRKGHVLFSELVAAGEVPVGLTIYSSNAESMKRRGGPIDWVRSTGRCPPAGDRRGEKRAASACRCCSRISSCRPGAGTAAFDGAGARKHESGVLSISSTR